jgi:uncharacterized protein
VFSGIAFVAGRLIVRSVLALALLIGPAYARGMFVGSRLFGLASQSTFRWICYALVAMATVVSLPVLDDILR